MDVYFYEVFEEESDELQKRIGKKFSYVMTSQTIQEKGDVKFTAKLISIRTQSKIPIDWVGNIDGVLSRSTGYDHLIEFKQKVKEPIHLGYLEEYATRAVAEHAILLLMALLRKLPKQQNQFVKFERDGLTGSEVKGKNLLVVGVGRIGSEIVKIGKALGMDVRGVDIVPNKRSVHYVSKIKGVKWADIIICAMNLTAKSIGYFNYDFLKKSNRGSIFVNIARGEHAPLVDLLRLIQEGHIGGVGLDVYEDESLLAVGLRSGGDDDQLRVVHQLLEFPNVVCTPHNAFNTREAVERKSEMTIKQIEHFLELKCFKWEL